MQDDLNAVLAGDGCESSGGCGPVVNVEEIAPLKLLQ
jgi:hypothetical protein